jgi:hypothetical protein
VYTWASAQQAPSAVIADGPTDKKFPPGIVGITVPSHGVEMDATFCLAGGANPHGTVLLLHGIPGYETNGDVAGEVKHFNEVFSNKFIPDLNRSLPKNCHPVLLRLH